MQLKNGGKTLSTHSFLDNGCCQSLMLKSAASELNIDMKIIGKVPINGYHMTKEINCAPVKVYIKPLQSDQQSFLLTDVITVPNLNMSPVDTKKLNQLCASFEHLSHISFPDIGNNPVSIIRGIDNLDLIHYKQTVKGPKNAPWGVETQLGWTCAGKTVLALDETYPVQFTQLNCHPNMDEQMFKKLSDWMKIESLGIASPKKAMSKNDKRAHEILDNTTQLIELTDTIKLVSSGRKMQNFPTTDGSLRSNFNN